MIKAKILKFLIKKNGLYDRERLILLSERSFSSILICWVYRKFLKTFCNNKTPQIHRKSTMERIGDLMSPIRKK